VLAKASDGPFATEWLQRLDKALVRIETDAINAVLVDLTLILNRMPHPAAQIELNMLLNSKQILQPVAPAWCSIAQTGRYGGGQF